MVSQKRQHLKTGQNLGVLPSLLLIIILTFDDIQCKQFRKRNCKNKK